MTCEFIFLAVGNADSIIIRPENGPSVLIDVPRPLAVTKWLKAKGDSDIGCIFITHAHRDHFVPMERFVTFLEQWVRGGGLKQQGFLPLVLLPLDTLQAAFTKVREFERKKDRRFGTLRHALDNLMLWREKRFHVENAVRTPKSFYSLGPLNIYVLHPETVFLASHSSSFAGHLNERSLVLRVTYGDFAALLLADLEGIGISECLKICTDEELRAQLVKIPHHGAWPINSADLVKLLNKIDAEIAILSVGSQNPHGHVLPELFRLLIELKYDTAKRLKEFVCTEATRTCVHSSSERKAMGQFGLNYQLPCAGDITIIAEISGKWTKRTQTDHSSVLSGIKHAACLDRADI